MMNPRAPPPPAFRVNNTPDSAGATRGHSAGALALVSVLVVILKNCKTLDSFCQYRVKGDFENVNAADYILQNTELDLKAKCQSSNSLRGC